MSGYSSHLELEVVELKKKLQAALGAEGRANAQLCAMEDQRDELLQTLKILEAAAHSVLIAGGDYGDDLSDHDLRKTLRDARDLARATVAKVGAGETAPGAGR